MPADHAEVMRAQETGCSDACLAGQLGQARDGQIEGRKGKAALCVDHQGAGAHLGGGWNGVAIDLAGARLACVTRHAGKPVAFLAVDLRLGQSARHRAGIGFGRVRGDEGGRNQRLQLGNTDGGRAHRVFFRTRTTLSTVMKLTLWVASKVTPEMCGVRMTLGMPANSLPASALIGSWSNTSSAAPPR